MSQPDTIIGEQRTVSRTFYPEDAETFAALSKDRNPLHLDPEYAAETRFGEPIVHGALVSSLISAALARFDGTVIFVNQEVHFEKPVYFNDRVTATTQIIDEYDSFHDVAVKVEDEEGDIAIQGRASIIIDSGADQ